MTDDTTKEFLLKLISQIDYDIYKSYDPELAEEPEYAEQNMIPLINMLREFVGSQNYCDCNFHDDEKPYMIGGD